MVLGRPEEEKVDAAAEPATANPAKAVSPQIRPPADGGSQNFSTASFFASTYEKADLLQFQVYVRQRLGELEKRMPPQRSTRERAELAFLEEQVVEDNMSKRRRKLRDPLYDVPADQIVHTNLNLLSRFVSEAGAILPRRLTGVKRTKQKKITKSLKRAHQLALLPTTWKHPKYRHANYADQYSMPEKVQTSRGELDEFRDPPDIRFPNRDRNRGALKVDVSRLARSSPGLPSLPPSSSPGRL